MEEATLWHKMKQFLDSRCTNIFENTVVLWSLLRWCFNRQKDVVESGLVKALQLEAHVMVKVKEQRTAEMQSDGEKQKEPEREAKGTSRSKWKKKKKM
ncbi:hypothetical protein CDAR_37331 [Caerostris darwini]|uniref:Uncharacterized protein n=1 Tax=Caerostris darwini TaxID=1538125 RepID=A0AAV4TS42_9ARAC|nr:hypothetical protein CDAR_37331 [Caerostris darwini]